MFRALPNTITLRPADANESQAAWAIAYEETSRPSVLAFTRQALPVITSSDYQEVYDNVVKGAYVIHEEEGFDHIIVATGSEVSLAIDVAKKLKEEGIKVRVVSMPSQELFDEQTKDYKETVLPSNIEKVFSLEMGSTFGWEKYTKDSSRCIGVDTFGASGPAGNVLEKFGFTVDKVAEIIKK
jgi:transketolase